MIYNQSYFYGIQLVRQLFYLDDGHFQFKIILMYIFLLYLYVQSVNKLSIYLCIYLGAIDKSGSLLGPLTAGTGGRQQRTATLIQLGHGALSGRSSLKSGVIETTGN